MVYLTKAAQKPFHFLYNTIHSLSHNNMGGDGSRERATMAKAKMELEELYLGIPDDSVNLTFQDLADVQRQHNIHHPPPASASYNSNKNDNLDAKKKKEEEENKFRSPSSTLLDPIFEGSMNSVSPISSSLPASVPFQHRQDAATTNKIPSFDFNRGRQTGNNVINIGDDSHMTIMDIDSSFASSGGQYHRRNDHDLRAHNKFNYEHPPSGCSGGGHDHSNVRRAVSSMAAYEADVSIYSNYSQAERSVAAARSGRCPGIPHSNICTVCSNYIYIFRHRCLVCGRVYCRQCVSIGMGEMTEGRKCIECLGKRYSLRYIHRAGKVGWLCFGYGSAVKKAELKWAEKGPRRTRASYGGSLTMVSARSTGPTRSPQAHMAHSINNAAAISNMSNNTSSNQHSFVVGSSPASPMPMSMSMSMSPHHFRPF